MAEITAASLEAKIKAGIPDILFLSVEDTSDGCGAKFAVQVVSKSFDGKTPIERHQSILGGRGVLAEEMKTVRKQYLHKMSMCTLQVLGVRALKACVFHMRLMPYDLCWRR